MDIHTLAWIKIQDVVIEFRNHVIFHDWVHFRGRLLPLKSGGCKILRWWGYHHQIWSDDMDMDDDMMRRTSSPNMERWNVLCVGEKEDIIYVHRSEFAISSLLWINSLSSFIRNQQLNSYFLFQDLSRYMTYFTEETPSKWFMVRSSQEPF